MISITPFLWFDNNVPEAVAFYKSVFPNAKVETVNDFMATFELEGQRFNALNGGPKYKFNEAISFFISVGSQEEVDYFWNRLIADGGEESKCGWLKDKFGLSWQVVPTALSRYLSDPDRKKADRARQAMMKMQKIVIADLDKAYAGGSRKIFTGDADRLSPRIRVDIELGCYPHVSLVDPFRKSALARVRDTRFPWGVPHSAKLRTLRRNCRLQPGFQGSMPRPDPQPGRDRERVTRVP
jgi:predicted 3-demethylubiquinone-9 3-methyltransferase (glyoxalase superfamily)